MKIVKQDEVLLKDRDQWLLFGSHHKIVVATDLEDVADALAEVESLVDSRGWHAAGFVSYEAAPAFDPVLLSRPAAGFPYLWFGLYPPPQPVALPRIIQTKFPLIWQPAIDRDTYNTAIEKIRDHIAEGRTYQVNYTMRLRTDFTVSPWEFFLHFAQAQNNHAAYLDIGRYVICSASPELFFQLEGNRITCRPMKGTMRRGRTTQEDRIQADWLHGSEKNRAENVMIVDMIRNDLGRIARIGSVRVPELFRLERYPSLWQMTSTVTAQTTAPLAQIFAALFPCASITGAPKVSTMRIIQELETTPRRIYTGAIGYFSPGRKACFNVAIRTALIDRDERKAEYGVGGGIVWDSTSEAEYAETVLKARVLTDPSPEFFLLETMLWTPDEDFFLKQKHIHRLLDSADYFDFPFSAATVEEKLRLISSSFSRPQRVRLLLDREGNIQIESVPISLAERTVQARLAESPSHPDDVFLFHKTTHRSVYEAARVEFPDCDDVLFYNERGELTEFSIGNLVVELDGELVTPPVECGLLPGTFRAYLLECGQIVEKIVPVRRLRDCTKVFRINSVRKWEIVRIQ